MHLGPCADIQPPAAIATHRDNHMVNSKRGQLKAKGRAQLLRFNGVQNQKVGVFGNVTDCFCHKWRGCVDHAQIQIARHFCRHDLPVCLILDQQGVTRTRL